MRGILNVLEELKEISYNTQNNNVVSDIYNVVTEIQGDTTYNDKIEEVCNKLDDIDDSINNLG